MPDDEASAKREQLEPSRDHQDEGPLTTASGTPVDDTDNSLRVSERGPTLLEDFHFREKVTHFDHERIPERVVHARGAGAYGRFRPYESLTEYTKADFLQDPARETPVFVRFSTVAGSRGSADTVRDVRGFATKFYTREGNYDLVGNNFPVFFIQDAVKFPDFVHAVKPEPHHEMPQAASAHDTFWDFCSLQPESMHTVMWLMSDRAIPRSYRMMQGFGVHTFRLVNAAGRGTFVKFHWRPTLGAHSLVWEEAQAIAGKDPDFNRRDLWESIEQGDFPEYELCLQLVPEEDEFRFDFDLLDATKLIPEETVPLLPVGRMILDRNPDNFFAETEQVAFHTAHVVPGIDFTNDPLLQGRNFSYLDTQLIRLGGPNFQQIPVNRPVSTVTTTQRDGYGQQRIDVGRTSYTPNSLSGGCPALAAPDAGAYAHHQERVDGATIKKRSDSFADHHGQATLFWNSMADWEKDHIVAAYRFELGKVTFAEVRERTVDQLNHIDHTLATRVAEGIGVPPPKEPAVANHGRTSPALSLANSPTGSIATRRVAILAADGVDAAHVEALRDALAGGGAIPEVLAARDGEVRSAEGPSGTEPVTVDRAMSTMASVLYDAVCVPGGVESVRALGDDGSARHYVAEAFKHGKPIAALGEGVELLRALALPGVRLATEGAGEGEDGDGGPGDGVVDERGVVTGAEGVDVSTVITAFADAIACHRHWDRDTDRTAA
ncbi:catalase [Streptomyces radicis]|uniref:Catalase n=1 Tax=Streptomyces radicis TaxID=1750517 RepID=A0A3A9VZP9_9ACTN|nr:catalase [Streptomyces radicis]RKN05673.1 catalase [Streptomyces radicis]RKN17512.1 catalase [Streptomyces radicis]